MKITITPEDMLKGLPIEDGWYKAEIMNAISKPSKDQGSINYVSTLRIVTRTGDEREVDGRFNSKAIGFIKPYLAALAGKTFPEFIAEHKKSGIEFDFEATKGGKLQVKIQNKLFEGRQVSEVVDYAPYDYAVPF